MQPDASHRRRWPAAGDVDSPARRKTCPNAFGVRLFKG